MLDDRASVYYRTLAYYSARVYDGIWHHDRALAYLRALAYHRTWMDQVHNAKARVFYSFLQDASDFIISDSYDHVRFF